MPIRLTRGVVGSLLTVVVPCLAWDDQPDRPGEAGWKSPWTRLDNGLIEAAVMLPDNGAGFYRQRRFDWSGMVAYLRAGGRTFVGVPTGDDLPPRSPIPTLGLAGEFIDGQPTGRSGEIVRIGVGRLEFEPGKKRPLLREVFPWEVTLDSHHVEFVQEAAVGDVGYRYRKTVRLAEDAPVLRIESHLENTGKSPLKTQTYLHNFLSLDGATISPDVEIDFGTVLEGATLEAILPNGARIDRNRIVFEPVEKVTPAAVWVTCPPRAEGHFVVRNRRTGAEVSIRADWSPVQQKFYATSGEISPELILDLALQPGEKRSWAVEYQFNSLSPSP